MSSAPTALLHPFARPAAGADTFIEIVRGEGALVFDADGREYLDALASLWYCNVGHGRREIAHAVAKQLGTLDAYHLFDRFTNGPAEAVAAQVAEIAPARDPRVFLTNGGSEAVDTAIKLARITHALAGQPQRTVVVSRKPSYHGVTYGGLAATGLPLNQQGFGPMLPDVVQTPYDDLEAVRAVFAEQGDRIAAVIAEPVVGAGGVLPPPPGYFPGLRKLCDDHGALLILDEVICGFGRLGAWWGADHYGVVPDLQTFAKAVTSGYQPLGGVVVGRAVVDVLESDPMFVLRHGGTYSGHPAACAAALVVLDITRDEGLLDRAKSLGKRLHDGLAAVAADDDGAAGVRGDGAVWALVLQDGVSAGAVREAMLAGGVIARPIGESAMAYCPPLVTTDAQIDRIIEVTAAALPAGRSG